MYWTNFISLSFAHRIITYPYFDFIKIFLGCQVKKHSKFRVFYIYSYMTIAHLIQKFLKRKLLENRLTKRELSRQSGVPYNTLFQILHALRSNTNLVTIIKIANYFNCSIDEVFGRKKYILKNNYNNIDIILSSCNFKLRNFISYKIKEQNLNPYQLSKNLGFSETVIWQFINDDKITRMLNSSVILALADYFQVSIDEMIGRTKPTTTVNPSDKNSDKDTDLNTL